jgi:histidine phosphotransferase ChpT
VSSAILALMIDMPPFTLHECGGESAKFKLSAGSFWSPCDAVHAKCTVLASTRAQRQSALQPRPARANRSGHYDSRAGGKRMKSYEFASLLCSRLCHDLLSPVGALNNGIELLVDEHDPEMRARCLDLLGESARASANKLKFFRLAFGAAGGFADVVDTREARVAIEGLFGGDGRIQLGWMVDEPTMSKSALKILLNLVLLAGDALVRGGRLDVGAEKYEGGLDIVVRAEGPRIVLDPELKHALLGQTSEDQIAPRAAAAWLVHCLLSEGTGQVQIADGEEGVLLFGASLPA